MNVFIASRFAVKAEGRPSMLTAVKAPLQPEPSGVFLRRLLLTVGVSGALLALALLLWSASQVVLLVFAGVLVAVFLRSLTEGLHRISGLREGFCLAIVTVGLVVVVVAAGWLMAPSIGRQVDQLAEQLPQSFHRLTEHLQKYGWGKWLMERGSQVGQAGGSGLRQAATALTAALSVAANLIVIGFIGLYFASQPRMYLEGLLYLVPGARRDRIRQVLDEIGFELRWWLLGQVFAMLLIGTLTTIGLWILGIPLALILGIIAGLLNFVPNFGPWVAAVPGVLIAFADSPTKGAWVIGVYAGVQILESYCITPMVQQRTVDLPPAVTIASQVLMGLLLGVLGLTLATPLVVVALVMVKMLYVEDGLGERMRLPGRDRKPQSVGQTVC
jgi:predicted PurR-regulated permease PerM